MAKQFKSVAGEKENQKFGPTHGKLFQRLSRRPEFAEKDAANDAEAEKLNENMSALTESTLRAR